MAEWIAQQAEGRAGQFVEIYHEAVPVREPRIYPNFDRLLCDAHKGRFDAVVIYDLARLASTPHQAAFYKSLFEGLHIKLCCVLETTANGDSTRSTWQRRKPAST